MKNILEYLESSAAAYPEHIFIGEENTSVGYSAFLDATKRIASSLIVNGIVGKPVCVISEKNAQCLEMAFACVAAGGFYTIADSKMTGERIKKILSVLHPAALICDKANEQNAHSLGFDGKIFCYDELIKSEADETKLAEIRSNATDCDVAYVLFTSGSTGTPKGVTITHRAVLAYAEWVTKEFQFDSDTVFGSQTPFYFSMSVTDIFSAMKCGSAVEIIPKQYFSFPVELINYLNDRKINTIYWVPTALGIVANFKTFAVKKPQYLKNVLFAGEVMPTKQLLYWQNNLDGTVTFANLFGPTETTDICTFWRANRVLKPEESVPIGTHCDNCEAIIIDDNGNAASEGELYIKSSFLASGYYNNPEKTKEAFVQNPLNSAFPETVYKTGDLVRLNRFGEIEYLSRRDFQIKHMGYRIELGEIESNLSAVESIKNLVCIYNDISDFIVCVYEGKKTSEAELIEKANAVLPVYMRPNRYERVKSMPLNANGKIDRRLLLEQSKKGE